VRKVFVVNSPAEAPAGRPNVARHPAKATCNQIVMATLLYPGVITAADAAGSAVKGGICADFGMNLFI
jgi:hypothetical protein